MEGKEKQKNEALVPHSKKKKKRERMKKKVKKEKKISLDCVWSFSLRVTKHVEMQRRGFSFFFFGVLFSI